MRPTAALAAVLALLLVGAAAPSAPAQTLLRAPDDAPQYRLGKIRLEDDRFGKPVLVFTYTRTREGKGSVRVAGRSPDGPLQITSMPSVNRASGEIRLGKNFWSRGGGYDYEFYLVSSAYWADKHYGNCLVSNKVQIGNPGSSPSARRWNATEQAAYEKHQLKDVPPSSPPDGFEVCRFDTPLAAGMRVKAGYFGDWINAELLSFSESGKATVRFLESDKIEVVKVDGWLAASPGTLSRAASDPSGFSPSLRVLPGGKTPLPRDAGPIPADLELPDGTPLLRAKHSYKTEWETVYVVEDLGGNLEVISAHHRDFFGRRDGKLKMTDSTKRYTLAIRNQAVSDLKNPQTVKGWALNLIPKKERSGFSSDGGSDITDTLPPGDADAISDKFANMLRDAHIIERSYPIKTKIPKRCRKLPRDVEIPPGSPVAYCNIHRDWEAASLLDDEGDTVVVKEDDGIGSFAYRLPRYQVIIQDKTLRKMRSTLADKADDLKKTLRTWTDSTGAHKVEARFVAVEQGKVLLKTDAGREIKLPLARLSDEDRELIESLGPLTENPFE